MEAQLREYRARKAREKAAENSRRDSESAWTRLWKTYCPSTSRHSQGADVKAHNDSPKLTTPAVNSLREATPGNRLLRFLAEDESVLTNLLALKLALWLVLLALFVQLEFAAVFVVVSGFYLIYATLGTGRRRAPGEPSAYSVFNPDCEQIDGTLTAAQFERELKYGIGSTQK